MRWACGYTWAKFAVGHTRMMIYQASCARCVRGRTERLWTVPRQLYQGQNPSTLLSAIVVCTYAYTFTRCSGPRVRVFALKSKSAYRSLPKCFDFVTKYVFRQTTVGDNRNIPIKRRMHVVRSELKMQPESYTLLKSFTKNESVNQCVVWSQIRQISYM